MKTIEQNCQSSTHFEKFYGKENQFSQGELIDLKEFHQMKIDPHKIQRMEILPEFIKEPAMPLVIVDKKGDIICCDGWGLVNHAVQENLTSILCTVLFRETYSDEEVALNKLKARIKPILGSISYSEQVRGINIYCRKFNVTLVNQKGGDRKSSNFVQTENKARRLAEELDVAYSTLCGWHHSGLYLNEEALNVAVMCNFSKKQFNEINEIKDRFYLDLKGIREERTINDLVSNAFIKAFAEIPANNLKEQNIKELFVKALNLEQQRCTVLTTEQKQALVKVWEGFSAKETDNAMKQNVMASFGKIKKIATDVTKNFSLTKSLTQLKCLKTRSV